MTPAASLVALLSPRWRAQRSPLARAGAWAGLVASLTAYAIAVALLAPTAGPGAAALFAIPSLVGGWAFGLVGGALVAAISFPLHGVLFPQDAGSLPAYLGAASSFAVGVSVGLLREMRERVREQGLRLAESEERYRQLTDNSPEGVLVHDKGVVVFANPAMARLLGAARAQDLVGRTLVTLVPFEDREALGARFVFPHPDRHEPRCIEARLARADGDERRVVMTSLPIAYRGTRAHLVLVREQALITPPAPLIPAPPVRYRAAGV